MFKRLLLSLVLFAGFLSQSFAAGTIPFSLSQQFDSLGKPLAGCKFYSFQAGTTSTPQSAYQDSALTITLPNPQTCDSAGRLPQMFFADGSIKIRITNSAGVVQVNADNIQVIGNSSGGGGGSPVDPTTVLATGDVKPRYGTGVLSGFVRANGRTIGSASSGASERANSDCQSLFEYLWTTDINLSVSTGRGASANADWVANKTLTLPDWRGRTIAGMDDMGNTAAGRLTSSYFGASSGLNGTRLGADGGSESHAQTATEMATHTHTNTFNGSSGTLTYTKTSAVGITYASGGNGANAVASFSDVAPAGVPGGTVTINSAGNGAAMPIVSPMMVLTIYMKL